MNIHALPDHVADLQYLIGDHLRRGIQISLACQLRVPLMIILHRRRVHGPGYTRPNSCLGLEITLPALALAVPIFIEPSDDNRAMLR